MIRRWIAGWVGAAVVFVVLDAIWLSLTNATLYRAALGPILADDVRLAPAALFYLVYLTGVVVFGVAPAIRSGRWRDAAIMGGLFGFFAYATYDLTNQSTLKVWASRVTIADLSWGTFLSATGATAGYFAARMAIRR